MVDMATQCLPCCLNIVVLEPKLFACLGHDGCDLGVVGLNHSRKEMVSCLMVQGSSEDSPKPAVSGIVLCCCYLHFRPGGSEELAWRQRQREGRKQLLFPC